MIGKEQINTICWQKRCCDNRTAIFHYKSGNQHSRHHFEMVKPLHELTFIDLSFSNAKQQASQDIKQSIITNIAKFANQIGKEVTSAIKQMYVQKQVQHFRDNFTKFKSTKDIQDELKKQNYHLLKEIIDFKHQEQQPYLDHYFKKKVVAQQKRIQENIKQAGDQLRQIIQLYFQNPNMFKPILKDSQNQPLIHMQNQQPQNHNIQHRENQHGLVKLEQLRSSSEQNQRQKMSQQQIQEEHSDNENKNLIQQNHINSRNQNGKNKIIKKESRATNPPINRYKKRLQIKEKNIINEQKIIKINQYQAIVENVSQPQRALQYLKSNFSNLSALHIFTSQFATKQIIADLLKFYKQLKTITFNCPHQFESLHLSLIPESQLANIKKIELKWDFDRFFDQYQIQYYFRSKKWQKLQHNKLINFSKEDLLLLRNNQTIWLQSKISVKKVQQIGNSLDNIKTLHFVSAIKQLDLHIRFIANMPNLINLTTLRLKEIILGQNLQYFEGLISNNINLQNLLIQHCISIKNPNHILSCLSKLPNLHRFSFKARESLEIDANQLFGLVHLTSLYLDRINFTSINSVNSSCLSQINRLQNLTHLSLYDCHPISSDCFVYFGEKIMKNIKFLNLGFSSINNQFRQYLIKMIKLEYLNIQFTPISGNTVASAFQEYFIKNKQYSNLKYLSIGDCKDLEQNQKPINGREKSLQQYRFTCEDMYKLAIYLPHLQYLDIYGCQNLEKLNFQQFSTLKTIGVNKQFNKRVLPKSNLKVFVY